MPLAKVFLDAAYAIALANPADEHHAKANALADQLLQERSQIVTTRAVLVEIGNFLAKLKHRAAAVELLSAIERDPTIEIVPLTASNRGTLHSRLRLVPGSPRQGMGPDRLLFVRADETAENPRCVDDRRAFRTGGVSCPDTRVSRGSGGQGWKSDLSEGPVLDDRGAILRPEFHGDTDHLEALLLEQVGGDRTVHAPAHADHYARLLHARVGSIAQETVRGMVVVGGLAGSH